MTPLDEVNRRWVTPTINGKTRFRTDRSVTVYAYTVDASGGYGWHIHQVVVLFQHNGTCFDSGLPVGKTTRVCRKHAHPNQCMVAIISFDHVSLEVACEPMLEWLENNRAIVERE